MPILQTVVAGVVGKKTAKRVGRMIPNPFLRFVAVTAVTALVPLAVKRIAERRKERSHS